MLAGHAVDFVRRYDSLAADVAGSFGNGWQLALRDVNFATDVPSVISPLRIDSRVYFTLPNGNRAGFTFAPILHEGQGFKWYEPQWVADPGTGWHLASIDSKLLRAGDRFYDLETGAPYNPAGMEPTRAQFELAAPDGTRYRLNANEGVTPVEFTDGAV